MHVPFLLRRRLFSAIVHLMFGAFAYVAFVSLIYRYVDGQYFSTRFTFDHLITSSNIYSLYNDRVTFYIVSILRRSSIRILVRLLSGSPEAIFCPRLQGSYHPCASLN